MGRLKNAFAETISQKTTMKKKVIGQMMLKKAGLEKITDEMLRKDPGIKNVHDALNEFYDLFFAVGSKLIARDEIGLFNIEKNISKEIAQKLKAMGCNFQNEDPYEGLTIPSGTVMKIIPSAPSSVSNEFTTFELEKFPDVILSAENYVFVDFPDQYFTDQEIIDLEKRISKINGLRNSYIQSIKKGNNKSIKRQLQAMKKKSAADYQMVDWDWSYYPEDSMQVICLNIKVSKDMYDKIKESSNDSEEIETILTPISSNIEKDYIKTCFDVAFNPNEVTEVIKNYFSEDSKFLKDSDKLEKASTDEKIKFLKNIIGKDEMEKTFKEYTNFMLSHVNIGTSGSENCLINIVGSI